MILAALEDEHGAVTAAQVVGVARDQEHPWHPRFEWDDTIGGEKYRLQQARTLIRSIRYERRAENNVVRSVRYVRDPQADPREQRYVSVVQLASDEERARSALVSEYARVASLLRRTRSLAEVLGLADSVADLVDRVEGLALMLRESPHEGPRAAQ
jgi:hypothetical protein